VLQIALVLRQKALLFYFYVAQDLPEMQTSVYGKPGILSALSRTEYLESGIVGKYRLPADDDSAAVFDDFLLAVFVSRSFLQMAFNCEKTRNKLKVQNKIYFVFFRVCLWLIFLSLFFVR
jgi:hypothetical protein